MLLSYLHRHIKTILMLCLFVLIFAAVFSLYELPAEAVLYAAILCIFAGGVLFFIGYAGYLRRHRVLSEMLPHITLSLDSMPAPHGAPEADYQALINALFEAKAASVSLADTEKRDLVDYYTLWAHQIKTPIAAMYLLLQNSGHAEKDELTTELFKIEQYVEMVMQYLRLDSDYSDYVLIRHSLDDIVRQAVRKYARLFILKKIPLDFRETGFPVLTDEKWLLFVIEQILSNSLKYTRTGSISIYAEGESLVIADTGIGIRAEDLPRVFDKGFTGYNGRTDKKSSGIGLYLCRRITEKLGHTLMIESEVGRGTRVYIGFKPPEDINGQILTKM
ncbi:MAG: sensor histidine kinase [Oscillospiraceae bacterium]